jgi:hypothetical protein
MSDPYDSDLARREFAVQRSHKDAESSNATARGTAQAAILINGGAATAVLALLSKESLNPTVLKVASACLGGYALGVLLGAGMMFCIVRSLDFYSLRWRLEAHPVEGVNEKASQNHAQRWWKRMRNCFYSSMAAFILSSGTLAIVIFETGLTK